MARRGARLVLPVKIEGEYDLQVAFTRQDDAHGICFILPVGEHSVDLLLDERHGSGLEMIGDRNFARNGTSRADMVLTNGQKYTFLAKVRLPGGEASIETFLDGKPFIHWQGKESSLDVSWAWRLRRPGQPGLGANSCLASFDSAQLRVVSGKASWVEGRGKETPIDPAPAEETAKKAPVPDSEAQQKALKLVRNVFQNDYDAATSRPKQKEVGAAPAAQG